MYKITVTIDGGVREYFMEGPVVREFIRMLQVYCDCALEDYICTAAIQEAGKKIFYRFRRGRLVPVTVNKGNISLNLKTKDLLSK